MESSDFGYKTIVVGTDGSDRAQMAFRSALSLAKLSGATLHAVHVVHAGVEAGFADSVDEQMKVRSMRDAVARTAALVADDAERQGVPTELHNPSGEPADAIMRIARSVDADLIVVGNRGMSGAKRFVLGSVPNAISHKCACSVLIVDTDPA